MTPGLLPWPDGWPEPAAVLAAAAALLALATLVVVMLALRARRPRPGLREVRRALEDLTEGRYELDLEFPERDPAADLAGPLTRLAVTLRRKITELESRADLRGGVLESLSDALVLATDADYDIILAGGDLRAILGEEAPGLRGRHLGALLSPASWEKLLPRLARRSQRDRGISARVELLHRDGSMRPARLTAGAAPGGGVTLLVVPEPESETRKAGGNEAWRHLVEGLADGACVVQEGKIVYANHALARMVGVGRDKLSGRPFRELLGARHLLVAVERLERAAAGESVPPTPVTLLSSDGSERPADARLTAVTVSGKPGVALSLRDQTAEAAALGRAQAEQARLDAALEASSDALVVLEYPEVPGNPPRVMLANRRFHECFDVPSTGVLGRPAAELAAAVAPCFDDPAAAATLLERLIEDRDGIVEEELLALRPSLVWLQLHSAPVPGAGARGGGRIFAWRDVTARKLEEERLREDVAERDRARRGLERVNTELERLNASLKDKGGDLERLNEELRQLDAMKSDLLSNVSHELQTPLVSIKGYTEMILAGRLGGINDEQRQGLEVALRNINRLIGMINNLLSFSRMERDAGQLEASVFSVAELVDEVRELLRDGIERKGLNVDTRYETRDLMVSADRGKVSQVFTNLLDNAVKYNRRGGDVTIVVREGERGFLAVDVRDTGVGIPEAEQARIFDRFYRTAGTGPQGTGIGLAIVQEILRQHGCAIDVESRPGEGSTFTFTLPLARAGGAPPGPGPGEPLRGAVSTKPGGGASSGEAREGVGVPAAGRRLFRLVRPRRD